MMAAILFTGTGPLAVLTTQASFEAPVVLDRLRAKGIDKFVAFELPLERVRALYGGSFVHVLEDAGQEDELRVLDEDGQHIFKMVPFAEFGRRILHEGRGHEDRGHEDRGHPPQDPAAMI